MQKYYVQVFPDGNTYWYSDAEFKILHRETGPARIWPNGDKSYWINRKLHREDGPAMELTSGVKMYFQNGKLHREDGPARIWPDGKEEYWIDGVQYTKEAFLKKTNPAKELTVADIEKLLGYQVKIIKE